ncbi:MAG: hypothetical protein PHC88_13485 [Terrimicrobiaceae bacterium]|nr:hypothetical protein [Terrimicrobiaceae bacterium]
MIAFKNNIPLVRFDDGSIMDFESRWLSEGLARAASRAGYQKWWLAEHVTETVVTYLRNDFDGSVVALPQLCTTVQSVLQVIGYADVATHFEPLPPPVRLSLATLAQEAGAGYELLFFRLLQNQLRAIADSPSLRVELFDLHPCVKLLRCAKNWSTDCTGLRAEIVRFVREELDLSPRAAELNLQLS